jgi:hypothetical protein
MSISPPPYRDKDLTSQSWQKWFASITDALKTAAVTATSWASIDKAGSKLTDIETRHHDDLQNLNTATHTHLTSTQYYSLTGGGETSLHTHNNSASGMRGTPGIDGEDGQDGISIVGPAGRDGIVGLNGINGQDGEDGQDGMSIIGPQGIQGIPGSNGTTGQQGPIGLGIDGQDGEDGMHIPGPQGIPGTNGANGTNGTNGINGLNGTIGQDGEDGESGVMMVPYPIFNRRLTLAHISYRM